MKTKKSKANLTTSRTWILFGIFLIVSLYCLKVINAAQKMANSIVIPDPVVIEVPTKTVSPVKKLVK